ncbi:MAG TPA: histidine kinase [Thermoanaerobaculia bacterium]|nr:histidine kinase [Thermoanaerobaculia bacterium]
MRLLPRDPHLSWTRYAFLIYAFFIFFEPLQRRTSAALWVVTFAVLVAFLVLYFLGHWLSGWRALLVVAAIFALGAVFAPWNSGSSVFMIYAAGMLSRVDSARLAVRVLGVLLACLAVESWGLRLPPYFWIPAAVFMLLIGGINIHFAEVWRGDARLAASRQEVERLVRIAERERIGRDLHDLLGHTLSLITLKAELARKLVGIDTDRAAAEIGEVERISREALREVRSAVAGYRSEGLSAELARARLALESAAVRPEYFMMPVELPPAQEAALALALREAVTNVIRHAGARTCRIALEQDEAAVRLEVQDDGRGGGAEGTGLAVMRERIAGLGGRLERASDGGTRLVVSLPRRKPEPPAAGGGRTGSAALPAMTAASAESHG